MTVSSSGTCLISTVMRSGIRPERTSNVASETFSGVLVTTRTMLTGAGRCTTPMAG